MNEIRRLAAVMFTDIVGYTALMSEDESRAMELLQKNREIQTTLTKKHNGEFVKEMGDGTLLCFMSALDAVRCALDIQQASKKHSNLKLRIGIHIGDTLFRKGDVFGDGVNIASRIEPLAKAGKIYISGQVFQIVRHQPEIDAAFICEERLKNVDHPVDIYSVTNKGLPSDHVKALSLKQPNSEKRSIAVLPFTNMSADVEQEYFCDGIAEDILNDLTHIEDVRTVARTSSFAFKGKNIDIREIGRRLGADTLIEGSVRKAGNQLRITAQLINVADGYHLWSERYDRELEDVFAIQEEIAKNIIRALKITLSEGEISALGKSKPQVFQAYDYYLRGREYFHQGQHKSILYASEMFTEAIKQDPNYALAHAGLADCHSYLFMYFEKSPENIKQSAVASKKSTELDSDLAEAHTARGLSISLSKQYGLAETEFERAIELNPKLYEAYYFYARACKQEGKIEEAVSLFEKAMEVRPEDYQSAVFLVSLYKELGLSKRVVVSARLAVELIEKHLRLDPDDARALSLGGTILIFLGEEEKAIEWASHAHMIESEDPRVLYNIVCIFSLAGRIEKALDYFESAISSGYASREWIDNDTDLDPIRDQTRFQKAIKNLN